MLLVLRSGSLLGLLLYWNNWGWSYLSWYNHLLNFLVLMILMNLIWLIHKLSLNGLWEYLLLLLAEHFLSLVRMLMLLLGLMTQNILLGIELLLTDLLEIWSTLTVQLCLLTQ